VGRRPCREAATIVLVSSDALATVYPLLSAHYDVDDTSDYFFTDMVRYRVIDAEPPGSPNSDPGGGGVGAV